LSRASAASHCPPPNRPWDSRYGIDDPNKFYLKIAEPVDEAEVDAD